MSALSLRRLGHPALLPRLGLGDLSLQLVGQGPQFVFSRSAAVAMILLEALQDGAEFFSDLLQVLGVRLVHG
jgi:hypothetical protein